MANNKDAQSKVDNKNNNKTAAESKTTNKANDCR